MWTLLWTYVWICDQMREIKNYDLTSISHGVFMAIYIYICHKARFQLGQIMVWVGTFWWEKVSQSDQKWQEIQASLIPIAMMSSDVNDVISPP